MGRYTPSSMHVKEALCVEDFQEKNICPMQDFYHICPIVNTHDKFEEAHYFFHIMMFNYHDVDVFRYNLNAFVQSLRSVTFILQSEKDKIPDFDAWYEHKRVKMKENILLKNFVEGRNIVVHSGMLRAKSNASLGLFRGRKEKLCLSSHMSPFMDSKEFLQFAYEHFVGFLIDEEHSSIGEQLGIRREWIVEELGDSEVADLCYQAWINIGDVVKDAHKKLGFNFVIPQDCKDKLSVHQVLLETDLDPSLIEKWDW